jgi:hypothetical protein
MYIAIAVFLGIAVESRQNHPVTFASVIGASGMALLLIAIIGEFCFWIWRKISN